MKLFDTNLNVQKNLPKVGVQDNLKCVCSIFVILTLYIYKNRSELSLRRLKKSMVNKNMKYSCS